MKKLLDEILEHKVAILDCDTNKEIETVMVDSLVTGFDLYIDVNESNTQICLYDTQDEDEETELGNTMYDVLNALSKYNEFFNDLPEWESDFFKYYKKITN
ncbi:hypothetical protein [Enterococcus sp. N249-2]